MSSVIVAISSFRSDQKVLDLLDLIFSSDSALFLEIIVVDSKPTGLIDEFIFKKGYPVKYITSEENLGSAGNLDLRLREAAKNQSAQWCLCLNHDAFFSENFIKSFVEKANTIQGKIGAVFPTRTYANGRVKKTNSIEKMQWSSSNGCLYCLNPVRDGLYVDSSLWMGWEDYLYCTLLKHKGYENYIVNSIPFIDSYEYKNLNVYGLTLKLNDKPSWYDYYSIRNLIYIGKKIKIDTVYLKLLIKVCINSIFMSFLKEKTSQRQAYFFKGVFDGFKNKMGFKDII
ncbi:glycosyltransferase family 2 protein [Acinetobacter johnsonii]|uniref:glycosyltransferase family 2 protein n=1 Tax=Acinetobacter johnsonii TaxID=40214 RepID=UPI0021E1C8C3|nr:glycosyltransferase [Acinetobacter johnsonii]MCV2450805.1 glycosyltransferase [Acinetobacter johnsonii]